MLALASVAVFQGAFARAATTGSPNFLRRCQGTTVVTRDLATFEDHYTRWLDYRVRERGEVPSALARSWDAIDTRGLRYALLSPDGAPDVHIRAIEDPQATPSPWLTTFGWSAMEIIVDEPDRLFEQMRGSPFRVIGEPAPLGSFPTIRAFQVVGSAGEVLYLTSETGDRSKSILPLPNGRVGRVFIMVLAASNPRATLDWYARAFSLTPGALRTRPNRMISEAQGIDPATPLQIATARLAEHGNLLQVDGYSDRAVPRPLRPGRLPPAIAITSFGVPSLDDLPLDWIEAPAIHAGRAYSGRRAATVRGPDGELIELIED